MDYVNGVIRKASIVHQDILSKNIRFQDVNILAAILLLALTQLAVLLVSQQGRRFLYDGSEKIFLCMLLTFSCSLIVALPIGGVYLAFEAFQLVWEHLPT